MPNSFTRMTHLVWLLVVSLVVSIVGIVLTVLLYGAANSRQTSDIQCVTDWANATAARNDLILAQSNVKNAAQDNLDRSIAAVLAAPPGHNAAQIKALLAASQAFLKASNTYNNTVRLHPLPPSPQLVCGHKAKASALPGTVVVTRTEPGGLVATTMVRPGPTMRSTVTVPQPTTVPGAVGTVAVPMPGNTVTVTRTVIRTRTVTREPPPCLKNLTVPPCVIQAQGG